MSYTWSVDKLLEDFLSLICDGVFESDFILTLSGLDSVYRRHKSDLKHDVITNQET